MPCTWPVSGWQGTLLVKGVSLCRGQCGVCQGWGQLGGLLGLGDGRAVGEVHSFPLRPLQLPCRGRGKIFSGPLFMGSQPLALRPVLPGCALQPLAQRGSKENLAGRTPFLVPETSRGCKGRQCWQVCVCVCVVCTQVTCIGQEDRQHQ